MEILDSRGNPTLRAFVTLMTGFPPPPPASFRGVHGEHEALELRDGDGNRYGGKGTLQAVFNVNQTIAPALIGMIRSRRGTD